MVKKKRERRIHTAEFKREAVRRVREQTAQGVPFTQVARDLDLHPNVLQAWVRHGRPGPDAAAPAESLEAEVRRLRHEVATLREEAAFAKKAAAYFAREVR